MSYDTRTNRKTEMTVADFVISGELFEMAAGPVGFAAGAQWRDESNAVVRDPLYTQKRTILLQVRSSPLT